MAKFSKPTTKQAIIGASIFVLLGAFSIFGFNNLRSNQRSVDTNEDASQQQPKEQTEDTAQELESTPETEPSDEPDKDKPKSKPPSSPAFSTVTYSLAEAQSLIVVVNKKHKLPSSYKPSLVEIQGYYLRSIAVTKLSELLSAAESDSAAMNILSAYRSYATQEATYQRWVNQLGKAEADRVSARPGHSEHQTGLAVDLGDDSGACNLETCFGETPGGKWLAKNAHSYGFIIRYPAGKESLTGYSYEPWHLRYVGVDTASAIFSSGQTMDQHFNVPAGGY